MSHRIQSDYKIKVARLERDKSKLLSDLTTQREEVSQRNQTISTLQTELQTARGETVTLRANYDSKVADNASLQFDLVAQREELGRRNQTISDLQSALAAQREDAAQAETIAALQSALEIAWGATDTIKADYDSQVTVNANLQSDLTTKTMEVAQANQTILELRSAARVQLADSGPTTIPNLARFQSGRSDLGDFKEWMRNNSINTDTPIDPSTFSGDIHHMYAHNALVNLRAAKWSSAFEDAERVIFHSSVYLYLLIHPSSLSAISRQLWAILPRLSHKSE